MLNIRDLPTEVHARLRIRAAEAGRSMEAEARAILAEACLEDARAVPATELQKWVDRLYGSDKPEGVVDSLIEERRKEAQRE